MGRSREGHVQALSQSREVKCSGRARTEYTEYAQCGHYSAGHTALVGIWCTVGTRCSSACAKCEVELANVGVMGTLPKKVRMAYLRFFGRVRLERRSALFWKEFAWKCFTGSPRSVNRFAGFGFVSERLAAGVSSPWCSEASFPSAFSAAHLAMLEPLKRTGGKMSKEACRDPEKAKYIGECHGGNRVWGELGADSFVDDKGKQWAVFCCGACKAPLPCTSRARGSIRGSLRVGHLVVPFEV